jgi:hypothetical protein
MTGTNGIATAPGEAGGGVVAEGGGELFGGAVGPLTGGLGFEVTLGCDCSVGPGRLACGVGIATEVPGAAVGGVEEPHALARKATTATVTSRIETDRLMAVDLTDKETPTLE